MLIFPVYLRAAVSLPVALALGCHMLSCLPAAQTTPVLMVDLRLQMRVKAHKPRHWGGLAPHHSSCVLWAKASYKHNTYNKQKPPTVSCSAMETFGGLVPYLQIFGYSNIESWWLCFRNRDGNSLMWKSGPPLGKQDSEGLHVNLSCTWNLRDAITIELSISKRSVESSAGLQDVELDPRARTAANQRQDRPGSVVLFSWIPTPSSFHFTVSHGFLIL